jgi:hypothetical protein
MSVPALPSAKCPQCGGMVALPAVPSGAPVACLQCGFAFVPMAPMAAPMAMPLPPHLRGQVGPMAAPMGTPVGAPMAVPYGNPSMSMPPGGGPLPPHLMPQLSAASVVGDSIAPIESAAIARAKQQRSTGCMLYAILGILVLVAGGVFAAYIAMSPSEDEISEEVETQEEIGSDEAGGDSSTLPGNVKVIHVERESKRFTARHQVKRDDVIVRVESVTIGPVEFQNASGQVRFTDDKNYLTVNFRFSNQRDVPVKYLSWYDNVFDVAGKKQRPRLLNAEGTEEYACLEPIEGARRVGYHSKSTYELPVSGYVRDSVIFQITPEVAANPPTFHLDLPGGALNSATLLKFEIPPDMIQIQ